MVNKVKKNTKVISKPRNYVAVAMIRSGKSSGAHQKNHRRELEEFKARLEEDELYSEYDDGSY